MVVGSKTKRRPIDSKKVSISKSKKTSRVSESGRPIVFAGPSISSQDVLELLPDADVRRPIRRGDLVDIRAGALVAIIDGVFDAELSVSPREIRNALGRGVRIVGSSSMGALRASEVPRMIGIGRVYEMYRDGKLSRDDEVAILLDDETGRALTEPLVNVKFAVERLVSSGTLSQEHGSAIISAASDLHFTDRTYRNILRRANLRVTDEEPLRLALKAIDLKREDAISLLERLDDLGNDPSWRCRPSGRDETDVHDRLENVRISKRTAATAPLQIWEFGERVEFRSLLSFLALTGKLDAYARRAIARYMLEDGTVPHPKKKLSSRVPTPQNVFEDICDNWGWALEEEAHVTLRDLGVSLSALTSHCAEEAEARLRLASLYETMPGPFMQALRLELLSNHIALKREAMRYGSLVVLAARATQAPTHAEHEDAKRAILGAAVRNSWVETWNELVDRHATPPDDARALVDLVARARKVGVPLQEQWAHPRANPSRKPLGVHGLPEARYVEGSRRSVADRDAIEITKPLAKAIGITRVAQLSELDRIGGLHVTAAYRPSRWSTTLGSGKSESLDGAMIGAVMEELEKYCQEEYEPAQKIRRKFVDWTEGAAVDPREMQLPFDTSYDPKRAIDWSPVTDLVSGTAIHVPTSTIIYRRTPNDILFSSRVAKRMLSTNGLASGFSTTEAIVHALCEVIERHAMKLQEQETQNPGALPESRVPTFSFVDLETCPASTRRICEAIREGDREVRAMNITSEIGVPTFGVRVFRPDPGFGCLDRWGQGFASHPNAEFALNRAILEGVQAILMNVSGAREDLALRVRSLGRHERPRPNTLGTWDWFAPWIPKVAWADQRSFTATTAHEDLVFLINRLVEVGYNRVLYCDYSKAETNPAAVVRVWVPALEGINPLHTGIRARVHILRDLMHKHEW